MPATENALIAKKKAAKPVVAASVEPAVADLIAQDAKKSERSDAYVIRRILTAHYAPQLAKASKLPRQRLAA